MMRRLYADWSKKMNHKISVVNSYKYSNAQLPGRGNDPNSFMVARWRPPQTESCHVCRQRRQMRHAIRSPPLLLRPGAAATAAAAAAAAAAVAAGGVAVANLVIKI